MNRINKTRLLLLLLLLVTSVCSYAQEFPVQVNTTLLPPYSLYLSDYTSPERSSLQIQLQLRELDRPEYKVKLRVTIEGMGITLRTKGSYIPQPIVLQGGMPEILTGSDIKNYLNPDNLDFSGISKQEFTRKGTFPEGFYTFKIEVIDYVRNVVVSNPGFANAWIILNDPPIINLPFNDDKVIATDPQNVQFSWTPRHTASMNAAFDTEYEFTLVELYPVNRNPNDAIRVSRPIFQTITSATSLNYGITETLLIPGRKYAFRVRALDTSGRDLFKNQGYSEVFVFQFGDACIPPTNIKAEPLDDVRFKLTWDTQDIHTSYSVQYRKKGSNAWSDQNVNSNSVIVPGLQGNTEYEYQVRGGCGTIQGEYSPLASVTTLEGNPNEFTCGASPGDIEIKTVPLQKDLLIDDVIKTADFDIIISEVEANADGSYKGKGYAQLPWLNFVSVKVKFSNIKVNEDYRVFSGNVTTLYSKAKADAYMEKLKEMGEDAPKENKTPDQFVVEDTISFAGEIKEISVDVSRGVVVIVDASGETTEVALEKNEDGEFKETLVKDSNGDSWIVDKNGKVTEGPSNTAPAAIASESEIDFTIAFAASENQLYGFDQKEDYGTHYETVTIRGNQYTIPWKSVETGRQDEVLAKAIGKNEFPGFVGFKTATGEVLKQPSSNAGEKKVFAPGGAADDEQPLTAYVFVKSEDGKEDKEIEVARLNIKTYDKIARKVVVVPVNDASAPDVLTLQNELNKIYQQPVVQWEVEVAPVYQVDQEAIIGLDSQPSDWLASFPDKMQDFNKAYRKKASSFDKDAYHVFLVKGSGSSRAGFMPFKRKYGYIFTDNLGGENVIKTIAHELAHGAFRLRHTFSNEAFVAAKATTNNLMDYKGGTTLKKYQWDLVHDPESMIGWLESDEEGALNLTSSEEYEWILEIYSPYYSTLFKDAPTTTEKKQRAAGALKSSFGQEQLKSLASIYKNLPKKADGSIPAATLRKGLNPTKKGLYVFYTERSGTSVVVVAKPLHFPSDFPVDLALYTGEFDTKQPANEKEKTTVEEKFNNKIDDYNELLYDFVWETMTQKSLGSMAINWWKEFWDYPDVKKDSEKEIENLFTQIAKQPINVPFEMKSQTKIIYSYECDINSTKLPVAVYIPEENPKFDKLDFITFQAKQDKPYTIFSFALSKNPTKSKLLLQVPNEHANVVKTVFLILKEVIEEALKKDVLTALQIKELRSLIAQVEDENERKQLYLEMQKKVPYQSQMLNEIEPYVTCNQTSLVMCLEGLGIQNPDPSKRFADYLETYRAANNLGARTEIGTRKKELEMLGVKYEEVSAIDGDFSLFKEKLKPFLEKGDMITFSYGGHIVRLVEIRSNEIVVDDPYGCLKCKEDFLLRQKKEGNVFCNKDGHASCCTGTTRYQSPCVTNSLNDMSNVPGRHCVWSKDIVDALWIYNILVVKL